MQVWKGAVVGPNMRDSEEIGWSTNSEEIGWSKNVWMADACALSGGLMSPQVKRADKEEGECETERVGTAWHHILAPMM